MWHKEIVSTANTSSHNKLLLEGSDIFFFRNEVFFSDKEPEFEKSWGAIGYFSINSLGLVCDFDTILLYCYSFLKLKDKAQFVRYNRYLCSTKSSAMIKRGASSVKMS